MVEAEPAAEPDAHRVARGRPGRTRRQLGPPVDDHRVAQLVVDVPPPDVPALLAVLLVRRSSRPKNSAVVGSSTSSAGAARQGHGEELVGHPVAPEARADRSSRASGPARGGRSRGMPVRWPARRSPRVVYVSGIRKGPSTGGAPSGETRQCTCGRPHGGNRFREPGKGETGLPYPQPGRAARVTLRSCFCEPRMTVMVTVSPTLRSWMLATSASEESIGLPSTAMTASCACSPA